MMSPDPKVAKYRPTINADLQVMHMYITESIQGIHVLNYSKWVRYVVFT